MTKSSPTLVSRSLRSEYRKKSGSRWFAKWLKMLRWGYCYYWTLRAQTLSTRLVIGSTLWSAHSSTNMKLLAALQMSPILASEICKNLRYWHTSFTFFFSFTKYLYCMYLILSQVYCWDCTSFCESSCCIQLFASNLSLDQVRIRVVRRWLVDIQQQLVELEVLF